jgi:small nuclear ribonucleoprotein (snRNP)-like protein
VEARFSIPLQAARGTGIQPIIRARSRLLSGGRVACRCRHKEDAITHLPARASAATILGALALAIAPAPPAAAQPQPAQTTSWFALPSVVPVGSTVIVRTRDGESTKGRLSSLSDTAIVLEGGRVKSFPAADVVAIESGRERRAVKGGAKLGLAFGATFGLGMASSALDESYCDPESSLTWSDALQGGAALTAMGAGIGAGIGLLVSAKQVLVYRAETPLPPAKAPVPLAASWDAVPRSLAPGVTVVVKTGDGRSTKGRLRGVSGSAIVVESGKTMTIPAADVASIERRRGGRSVVNRAAVGGAGLGAVLAVLVAGGAMATEYCDCDSGYATERERGNALFGALVAPAIGAGIGAGIGLMVPGKRTAVYRQPVGPAGVSLAPIAGRGQRGVALRVAF